MKIKDCFWLWGQDAMSHQKSRCNATSWKLPMTNKMGPMEGAEYLGIPNMCRVVMLGKPEPPFDSESELMKDMRQIIYSAIGDAGSKRNNEQPDTEEVIRQAAKYSNVTGAILDDFFRPANEENPLWGRYPASFISKMREKLQTAVPGKPIPLWVVWYKQQLEYDIEDYLSIFDGITYWNMLTPKEKNELEDDLERMIERTPGKRRMTGCYIWNYGEGKPLTIDDIKFECETFYKYLKSGKTEGIIFCSNCCADIGGPAVDYLRGWIKEVGEEEL